MKLFATNKSRILVFNTFFTKNKLKNTFLKEKLEISGFFSNVNLEEHDKGWESTK